MPHTTRAMVDAEAARAGVTLNIALQVDGASFILDLVELGHGCAILPAFSLQRSRFPRKLQINEIIRPRLARHLKVAISLQRPATYLTQQAVQMIRHHLGPGVQAAKR
jgi:LysR family nitrogen assimilation transcriptional regulator